MYVVKQYESPITVFCVEGGAWHYKSKKALLDEVGYRWIMNNVGEHFTEFAGWASRYTEAGWVCGEPTYRGAKYIIRDDEGNSVTHGEFAALIAKRRKIYWPRVMWEQWNGEGTVPGVGRRRGGHYFRRLKTTNERRWSIPVVEDGEPAPRARRSHKNLPNAWDDYQISSRADRNWKRFRKTQWKAAK